MGDLCQLDILLFCSPILFSAVPFAAMLGCLALLTAQERPFSLRGCRCDVFVAQTIASTCFFSIDGRSDYRRDSSKCAFGSRKRRALFFVVARVASHSSR